MSKYSDEWITRFWSRVKIEHEYDCWEWQLCLVRGYGLVSYAPSPGVSKMILCHRVAWELTYEEPICELLVLHHCDNPACVNPKHLWLGTQKENMRDMTEKKRGKPGFVPGEKNPSAKLTEEQVLVIKERIKNGERTTHIAKDFNVVWSTISQIKTGRSWKTA